MDVKERVKELVSPVLDKEGFKLIDVQYEQEGSTWYLRIFIDREGKAIDVDDCTNVSRWVSDVLDEADPIPDSYILEVSSPGIEGA